eukprot:GHUV01050385.1.p2 GENE.GHUV01050385.1~~GHUV01050385.1.p2  ORF type:complete len:103 (-),score=36.20 GHUV01050385.1:535-843(-)
MVSGILTGVAAVGIGTLAGDLIDWKNGFVQELLDEQGQHRVFMAFLWHCAYSCLLVSFGVALVGQNEAAVCDKLAAAEAAAVYFVLETTCSSTCIHFLEAVT